ncbi:IS110 family transposase [Leifsonia sp. TF02-11]|uniref:IS110 family transposase n=1 Tax=Leifsonia sp. TF02-11 TaxID=2815212 RepID=UPI001AA19AAB|nr:IS110 family transposase [Leifsonia sp. TF02-11]MBO1741548.1 IS110 family transposase [Leifsonia sp. TF02-11]
MSSVADHYDHVVGVDTHARTHTYAVLEAGTGRVLDSATFPTTANGLSRALAWIRRRAKGRVLVAIEGASSYGSNLRRALIAAGVGICDVRPPKRAARVGRGKSDEIDAVAAARTAIASEVERLTTPRSDGLRSALRVLLVARQSMDSRRTAERNALTALLRSFDLGIDVRKPLTDIQVKEVAGWRQRANDDAVTATIRQEARRLAVSVRALSAHLVENQAALAGHVHELAPGLQQLLGVGAVTGAILVTAYSHQGRVRSEAAFAALAGASPLEASSGNTTRHRLNRHGDRQLNRALDVIARVRLSCDLPTREYLARRLAEGKSKRQIRRSLKRYIARQLFRHLSTVMA